MKAHIEITNDEVRMVITSATSDEAKAIANAFYQKMKASGAEVSVVDVNGLIGPGDNGAVVP
jgi:hypothetical protein